MERNWETIHGPHDYVQTGHCTVEMEDRGQRKQGTGARYLRFALIELSGPMLAPSINEELDLTNRIVRYRYSLAPAYFFVNLAYPYFAHLFITCPHLSLTSTIYMYVSILYSSQLSSSSPLSPLGLNRDKYICMYKNLSAMTV
jgi:hypothetical protein